MGGAEKTAEAGTCLGRAVRVVLAPWNFSQFVWDLQVLIFEDRT